MATRRKKKTVRRPTKIARRKPSSQAKSLSSIRFPGESRNYRTARDKLLAAEIELRIVEFTRQRGWWNLWVLGSGLAFTQRRASDTQLAAEERQCDDARMQDLTPATPEVLPTLLWRWRQPSA